MTHVPRLLVTIPHYFKAGSDRRYGSGREKAGARLLALRRCVTALHQSLGSNQAVIHMGARVTHPILPVQRVELDIVICTVGDNHLLGEFGPSDGLFTQAPVDIADPMLLGFECQRVLKERFGRYDWYAFMEDDLIIGDPWFLAKLAWFQRHTGPAALLLPNRFELSDGPLHKAYIDGDLGEHLVTQFLPKSRDVELNGSFLDVGVKMVRARNPHSGTFFLTAEQLGHWVTHPSFLDRDTTFLGPLESAATYGILRTFQIFKPHIANAAFLEIQHYGHAFLSCVGRQFPWRDDIVGECG